jgi:hypothetical protein
VPAAEVEVRSQPSDCHLRITAEAVVAPSLPPITGPVECGAPDVVRLEAVVLPNKERIAVDPPAIVRCAMAEVIASWVREEVAPRVEFGGPLEGHRQSRLVRLP